MKVKIQKWGHSLAIRIPSSYAKDAGITEGTVADVRVLNDSIIVKPMKKEYKLDDLILGIKRSNLHNEADSGASTGNESW